MKRLNFKKPFNGMDSAIKLIPDSSRALSLDTLFCSSLVVSLEVLNGSDWYHSPQISTRHQHQRPHGHTVAVTAPHGAF